MDASNLVKVSAKVYVGDKWASMRADSFQPVETAAFMLGRWSELYGRPEAINAQRGSKFWFRDGSGANVLIKIEGAYVADLRSAYTGKVAS